MTGTNESPARRLGRAHDVLWRRTAGSVVIRHLDGRGVVLSGTGPMVWDALDRPRTIEEMAVTLADVFDRPANDIASDLVETLAAMRSSGMVIEVEA